VTELLLANQADINDKNNDGFTPLYEAAGCEKAGCKEVMELLLTNKADVNSKDIDGSTPIKLAAKHKDVVELLRQHGGSE
jgi:uncharacterized protein